MPNLNSEESILQNQSDFIRKLIQHSPPKVNGASFHQKIPKKIIQFWDNYDQLPEDVLECINSWKKTEDWGIERLLFDKLQAAEFISEKLGSKYKSAFDKCYHPAMQADFFRLCYIFIEGGCYIDADDVYTGFDIMHLFQDEHLKIQPLCYDIATHSMVSPSVFTKSQANDEQWIFYFNNNPLIAGKNHIVVERALNQATDALKLGYEGNWPEIQSTTGPGNLTKAIFDLITENPEVENTLKILSEWEKTAISKWPLSYRNDSRNWRLANGIEYKAS